MAGAPSADTSSSERSVSSPRRRPRSGSPALYDRILAVTGLAIVVFQVAYMAADPFSHTMTELRLQVGVVALGVLLNQIGVWHISSQVFSVRRNLELRREVAHFISLVRTLHQAAGDNASEEVASTVSTMHESVDRMAQVAGKRDS